MDISDFFQNNSHARKSLVDAIAGVGAIRIGRHVSRERSGKCHSSSQATGDAPTCGNIPDDLSVTAYLLFGECNLTPLLCDIHVLTVKCE